MLSSWLAKPGHVGPALKVKSNPIAFDEDAWRFSRWRREMPPLFERLLFGGGDDDGARANRCKRQGEQRNRRSRVTICDTSRNHCSITAICS